MNKNLIVLAFVVLKCVCFSQTQKRSFSQNEFGLLLGGAYYIGDINTRTHLLYSKPAAGIFLRHSRHYRYAFRLGFNYGIISANDSQSGEADQIERNINFTSKVYEGNATAEFNFLDYRIGNEHDNFTLFLFAGIGMFYFDPQSDIGSGLTSLRGLKTESQTKSYSKIQMSVPFGIGFKWHISNKMGMSFEWGPRRTFTDYLDDVSGTYPMNVNSLDGKKSYTDRTLNGSATPGAMRGNPGTRDWYFFYGISINFKLPSRRNNVCYSSANPFHISGAFFKNFHLRNRKKLF